MQNGSGHAKCGGVARRRDPALWRECSLIKVAWDEEIPRSAISSNHVEIYVHAYELIPQYRAQRECEEYTLSVAIAALLRPS